jgi:hypothetical protein
MPLITFSEKVDERTICYLDIEQDLSELKAADLKNWGLFVIEDNFRNPILHEFADICIDKDVLYMCAAGKACSQIDDLFDLTMVIRELEGGKMPSWYLSKEDVLMTTWHYDFEEGFWFVAHTACYENFEIDKVLVVNLTKDNYYTVIQNLIDKFNNKGF